jgi:hypothetical protein
MRDKLGNTQILPESYKRIFSDQEQNIGVIIKGFFYYTWSVKIFHFHLRVSDMI